MPQQCELIAFSSCGARDVLTKSPPDDDDDEYRRGDKRESDSATDELLLRLVGISLECD